MYTIVHEPDKSLVKADALSSTPGERPLKEAEVIFTEEVTVHANLVMGALPGRDQSEATRRRRLSTGYAVLCEGFAQSSALAICAEAVPAST